MAHLLLLGVIVRVASTIALSAGILIACANEIPNVRSIAPEINDGVVVEATDKTREETGVHYWGSSNTSGPNTVKGYDEDGKEVVAFEYETKKEGEKTSFEATLDSGTNNAALKAITDGASVVVLEDSFRGRARPMVILGRLVADLMTQAVQTRAGGGADTLGIDSDRRNGAPASSTPPPAGEPPTLHGESPHLVSTCTPQLVPSSVNAGQTAIECAKDPNSAACLAGMTASNDHGNCCANTIANAERYLGRNASELKGSGDLPMESWVPPDICCANFVSAVLQQTGLTNWHSNGVADLGARLQADGWTQVAAADTMPGDVAIINGNGHTELVHSRDPGKVTLIGSNNINADGTQQISLGNPYGNIVYLTPPKEKCQR